MDNTNNNEVKRNFFQKYIYGDGGKTLLIVFIIGLVLAVLAPSLVNPPMVIIALAITIVIQRIKNRKRH